MRRDRVIRSLLRTRFLVTMKSGQTWAGDLVDVDARTLMLTRVETVTHEGDAVPADGTVYLPRADVSYMQRA